MFCFSSVYKKILRVISTAVIVFNKKGKVQFFNDAFCRYFPFSDKKQFKRTFQAEGNARRLKSLFERVACAQGLQVGELKLSVPYVGELREISLRMHVMRLDNRRCLGVVENAYEKELAKELTSAHNMQQRLLPVGKEIGGVPYSYMYIPCREIGGDLPDVYEVQTEGKKGTFGMLADVSGKGIAAGMLSSFVKAGFDKNEPSPAKAITRLNQKFRELNQDEKAYITVAAVRIDVAQRAVYYSVAGHNAPILLKSGENVSEIEMAAPPVSNWFENFSYEDGKIEYLPRDILVLLTDGVTESRNSEGEQFGIERVENVLLQCTCAAQFIERLQSELKVFCGGTFDDDLTAIAFDL